MALCFCKEVQAQEKTKQYDDNRPQFVYYVCGNDPRACGFFQPKGKPRPKPAPLDQKCKRCGNWANARMCGQGKNEGLFYRKCDKCSHFSWCELKEEREVDYNA
jgi:hypothetical protein